MLVLSLIITASILVSTEAYEPDRVTNLPGFAGETKFGTFSGYLDASPGTHLHYIFVESENDPANDPVLLWLNGGPACSSLLGFFTENGPFRVNGTELDVNPYAWNKVANIIFLESPAGVGYSYTDSKKRYKTNDDETSYNNLLAIKSWFSKFPEYKDNDFYLTGESYAGVYIATLSVRLLDEPSINYKGFAIGNGWLDQLAIGNTVIRFIYYHGLMHKSTWSKLVSECCENGDESPDKCDFANSTSDACNDDVFYSYHPLYKWGINPYSIYDECVKPKTTFEAQIYNKYRARSNRQNFGWSLIQNSIANGKNNLGQSLPCIDDTFLINYLDRDDVREALHIPEAAHKWTDCATRVDYDGQYNNVHDQIKKSISSGKRGLIYSGDTSMVCDFMSSEWFADSLGFQEIADYQPWYVNGKQVAGLVKAYRGFDFVIVKGAGHRVTTSQGAAALGMVTKFLNNATLARF